MEKYIKPAIDVIEINLEQTILTESNPGDLGMYDYESGLDQV